jgi:phosphatidate cytidylyltransferase
MQRISSIVNKVTIHTCSLCIIATFYFRQLILLPAAIFFPLILTSLNIIHIKRTKTEDLNEICQSLIAILYCTLPFGFMILIDFYPLGRLWLCLLMVVAFLGDTCAYYVGKGLGRHLLIPSISPKKTWEGAIAGLVGSVLGGALFLNAFKFSPLGPRAVILMASMAIVAQLGDLFESWLKRVYNFKDSGTLLPGHGGMLDRLDGLMFSTWVLYLYLALI